MRAVLVIVVALVFIGGAVFFISNNGDEKTANNQPTTSNITNETPVSQPAVEPINNASNVDNTTSNTNDSMTNENAIPQETQEAQSENTQKTQSNDKQDNKNDMKNENTQKETHKTQHKTANKVAHNANKTHTHKQTYKDTNKDKVVVEEEKQINKVDEKDDSKQSENISNKDDDIDSKNTTQNEDSDRIAQNDDNKAITDNANANSDEIEDEPGDDDIIIDDNENQDNKVIDDSKDVDEQSEQEDANNKEKMTDEEQENAYMDNPSSTGSNAESNNGEENQDEATTNNNYADENYRDRDYCSITPTCDDASISLKLTEISLDTHAQTRAEEERKLKGDEGYDDFMNLWLQTRGRILPKLTAHVGDVVDFGLHDSGNIRRCKAEYYTEVLEDFGNGWKDKKGDKSSIYTTTYDVSCVDNKTAIKVLSSEKLVDSRVHDNHGKQEPPVCYDENVKNTIANALFDYHAQHRAMQIGREKGERARIEFLKLWADTKRELYPKIEPKIYNINSLGVYDNNGLVRRCSASYHTEVLEDFGSGWKDKKGDRSPQETIRYKLRYGSDNKVLLDIE